MADENIVILQNSLDFMKIEHQWDSEVFPTSYHDNLTDGKIEEGSHKEVEKDPILITLPRVKCECEACTYTQY